jgi:hypothetical protein
MQVDTVLKWDETGKQYGEYRLRRPIVVGATVQMKPGHGYGLPTWVRSLKTAEVLEKTDDASLVLFVRGQNRKHVWVNDKELVNVG